MYLLSKCIKDVCKTHGENVAINFYCDGTVKSILYKQFNDASELVAGKLNKVSDIFPHHYVAVLLDVSDIFPAVIHGILLCESPFVCLDVDGSESDLIDFVAKLKIEILLTDEKHADKIRRNFSKSEKLKEFKLFEHVCEIWKTGVSHGDSHDVSPDSRLLYAIQTSGSTGEKKIVQVIEDCILPNLLELRDVLNVNSNDVIYYGSAITFDPHIVELFLALTSGAALFIVSCRARSAAIPYLVDILFPEESSGDSRCVTFVQTTPSIFLSWPKQLTRNRITNRLKILALGGEKFPSWDKLSEYCSPNKSLKIFNLYGITEVSCWASYSRISSESDCQILGLPMRKTIVQVRDSAGTVMNSGIGEIFIGSSSRICILGDESISKITTDSKKEPLFRATGDLVQVESEGKVLRFLGRKDRMVKRWGQKVNLALIEDACTSSTLVSNCCCIIDDCHRLVLFYQPHSFNTENDNRLRLWLKNDGLLLNSASIPDVIMQLHALPLNSNGKVDSSQLKKILKEATNSAIENEVLGVHKISFRSHLKSLWISCTTGRSVQFEKEYEKSNELNVENSRGFVASGGTSISALQFISKLPDFSVKVPSDLLADLLSDCTFDQCFSLFDERDCGSKAVVHHGEKGLLNISEPEIKRQKFDQSIFQENFESSTFQNNAESPILSVKCRGKCVMYSESDNHTSNSTENISLDIKWKYFLEKCVDASPTVVVFRNGTTSVTVGSHSGDLVNLDFESGSLMSACQLPDRIESSLAVSPCGKYGYIGCYDGNLRCLEMKTGETLLSFSTTGMVKSSPVLDKRGSMIVFGSYDQHLYCVSDKFQIIWKWKGAGSFYATPCIDHNKNQLFAGLLDGSCVCLEMKNGDLRWKIKLSSPVFSSPILLHSDAILFAEVSGSINCLNTACGTLIWSYKVGGNIFSSLTCAMYDSNRTLILFGCHDNHVYCLSTNSVNEQPQLLWKACLSAPVFATPFLEKDRVVAADTCGVISILKLADGHLLASIKLPGQIFSSPVIHNNAIFVGCRDNYLYCLCVNNVEL